MDANELGSKLIRETFHSFSLDDKFTARTIKEIAEIEKLNISSKEMLKKARGFIQSQKKMGLIEIVDEKWAETSDTNRKIKVQVYRKVGELSRYHDYHFKPIPVEYYDFVEVWNELEVNHTFTSDEFRLIVESYGIEITYVGQVSKFLWIVSDNGWCETNKDQIDTKREDVTYIRRDALSDWMFSDEAVRFKKVWAGEYVSKLKQIYQEVEDL